MGGRGELRDKKQECGFAQKALVRGKGGGGGINLKGREVCGWLQGRVGWGKAIRGGGKGRKKELEKEGPYTPQKASGPTA